MPRAKNPAAQVADYFQSAPIDAVETTLAIVKSIVERRRAPVRSAAKKRAASPGPTPGTPEQA